MFLKHVLFINRQILYRCRIFKEHQITRLLLLANVMRNKYLYRAALPTGALAISLWKKVTEDPDDAHKKSIADAITRADTMYDLHAFSDLYTYLKEQCAKTEHVELLWRLARATFEKAKLPSTKAEDKKQFIYEAFGYISRALELDDKSSFAAHKWYAILLESRSSFEGTSAKIKESYKIKEHLQKALDINPRDATTWHILGVWYFTIADLKWYERKLASTFFATPPSATYQQALDCFQKAETIAPNFYSLNLLYLAKVHKAMGQTPLAKHYLQQTLQYVVVSTDDYAAHDEAIKLLKDLK